MISILVAMDKDGLIGKDNDLPWRLPNDLKYFKQLTTKHTILMGRKTYESIGRPLPNRTNVVLTRNKDFQPEGCKVVHSVEEVQKLFKEDTNDEVFVIGGSDIFKLLLPFTDRLYITRIDESFEGDTFFPEIDFDNWNLVSKEQGEKDENNPYDYYFCIYDKKSKTLNN